MTDLLRRPRDVVAQTERGSVIITRRDATDLVLMRAEDLDRDAEGLALAFRIGYAALRNNGDMLAALRQLYPWTRLFSSAAQQKFAEQMDTLVWSSAQLGRFHQLTQAMMSWQGTAEALADGLRPDDPLDWFDDPPAVPRPE